MVIVAGVAGITLGYTLGFVRGFLVCPHCRTDVEWSE